MVHNENRAICQECNGACCKRFPGVFYAGDFRHIEFDPVKMVVDSTSGWTQKLIYHVRPRGSNDSPTARYSEKWGRSTCNFFIDHKGCSLPFKQRPYQCKTLDPKLCPDQKDLDMKRERRNLRRSWRKWQNMLQAYVNEEGEFNVKS